VSIFSGGVQGRSCSTWLSNENLTYGVHEVGAYHGQFGGTSYHFFGLFDQFGDVERCALR